MPQQRLVRFSDFHPAHNPEGYFYNHLLKHCIVRDEAPLLSVENNDGTYLTECRLRKIITSEKVSALFYVFFLLLMLCASILHAITFLFHLELWRNYSELHICVD